jgi:hypothetical protein
MSSAAHNVVVEEILEGSYDLHVHSSPDLTGDLRLDALDTGRHAQEAGIAGFVLKSHHYPTAPMAQALTRIYPGLHVAGSLCLNHEIGGLNPAAVEAAAAMGARVVWMPTFGTVPSGGRPGLRITDDGGSLFPQVHDIVDVVKQHEMVLASGHVPLDAALKLFQTATSAGVERMIVTHPPMDADRDVLRKLTDLGAYAEYPFLHCTPSRARATPAEIVATIREVGVDRCVVTTDFGQWTNPPPAEGMRMAIAELLYAGMRPDEVSRLVKTTPLALMDIDR